MAIVAAGLPIFTIGAGVLMGKALGASPKQVIILNVTTFIVMGILGNEVLPNEEMRPLVAVVSRLALLTICCLAGVLMTRFTCEKGVTWKQAISVSITTILVVAIYMTIFSSSFDEFLKED